MATEISFEVGKKRVFAWVHDWPGWCRAGKTEELAMEALAAYLPRYRVVTDEAGLKLPARAAKDFQVVDRVPGNATTDFGAPGTVAPSDERKVTPAQAKRLAALLEAAWTVFDRAVAAAPAELRKGPRGGGRDRDKMAQHVLSAEAGYARMIGLKLPEPKLGDRAAIAALRGEVLGVLGAASDGAPLRPKGWPQRYAARRFAWHVLDHVWEMEDRSEPAA
jgi:hypothetical protein